MGGRLGALANGWRGEAERIEQLARGMELVSDGDLLIRQRAATLRQCADELEIEVAVAIATDG